MFWNIFCSRTIMFTKEQLLIFLGIRVLGSALWSNVPSSPPTPHPHPNQPPCLIYIWGNSDSERPGDSSKISQARAEMLSFQHLYHLAQCTFHNIPLCQMIKLDGNLGFQRQADIFFAHSGFSKDVYQKVTYNSPNLENNIHHHGANYISRGATI